MAFLGLAFISCALIVTGLPPLAGFVAKFALCRGGRRTAAMAAFGRAWLLIILLLGGGLAGLIALSRVGMRLFWSVTGRKTPRLWFSEAAPVAFLLVADHGAHCRRRTGDDLPGLAAALTLHDPQMYIEAVLLRRYR